jgi:AcrR family transcriptional regulator
VDLLAEAGFARLTMEQVAARAGVGKASVYLRWPNKVALVAEAIRHRSGVVPEIPDIGSLRGDMLAFLRALMHGKPAAQRAVSAVTGETATNPELREAWRRGVTDTLTACVRAIVERAVSRGELPADTRVELLSILPLAIMQHWSLVHGQPPGEKLAGQIVDQFYTPGRAGHPPVNSDTKE